MPQLSACLCRINIPLIEILPFLKKATRNSYLHNPFIQQESSEPQCSFVPFELCPSPVRHLLPYLVHCANHTESPTEFAIPATSSLFQSYFLPDKNTSLTPGLYICQYLFSLRQPSVPPPGYQREHLQKTAFSRSHIRLVHLQFRLKLQGMPLWSSDTLLQSVCKQA